VRRKLKYASPPCGYAAHDCSGKSEVMDEQTANPVIMLCRKQRSQRGNGGG
jgi:hypothetical protein